MYRTAWHLTHGGQFGLATMQKSAYQPQRRKKHGLLHGIILNLEIHVADEHGSILAELRRILWRRELLMTQKGIDWLCDVVKKGAKEKELGPHRTDSPSMEKR